MSTWGTGKDEFPCEKCGVVHVVEWTDYPERDKGIIRCLMPECGGQVLRFNGTRDYGPARLKSDRSATS